MKRGLHRLSRLGLMATLAGSGAGLTLVAPAAPASASPTVRPIVCTAANQATMSSPVTVTGCQRKPITGGQGQIQGSGPPPNPTTLTWKTGDVFTFRIDSVTRPSTSMCPSGTAEVDARGTVLTVSGTHVGKFVGKTVVEDECLSIGLVVVVVELAPGTNFTIG